MKALACLPVFLLLFACNAAPAGVEEISADELLSAPPADALVLDVRSAEEFASGHVPRAVNIPHSELATRLSELPESRNAPVIVYCESGKRAGMAADVLLDAGYGRVLHLAGDMKGWREAGRPTAQEVALP